jgi:hydroxyethylthiazole kinase-like uncharacterized protein yjeF
MRPLLRPEEMARADAGTIEAGTPVEVLMERAGRAVARAAINVAGGRYGRRAVIVSGKGNNGGDGFVAARRLRQEGLSVHCLVLFDTAQAKGAPAHHLELMRKAGVVPDAFDTARHRPLLEDADVIVDAVFGTGFTGPPEGLPAEAITAIDGCPNVVAVDIPSGVNGTTGGVEGPAVHADVTVAMAAEKVGTALSPGAAFAGRVEVADIGIDVNIRNLEDVTQPDGSPVRGFVAESYVEKVQALDVAASLQPRSVTAHKRSVGSVAVLSGSDEIRGAPLLTVRGAIRAGAGYVTLGSTTAVKQALATAVPEALCREVSDSAILGPKALDAFGDVLERADALAIGPGLGRGEEQTQLVHRALGELEIPIVLDADGLNALEGDPGVLSEREARTVLTPHPGELARLLDKDNKEIVADRLASALEASERFPRAVVLLKGWRTLIAYGGGRAVLVVPVGGPELASAGTGDVLTGAIAALLATGVSPVGAAVTGAYLHGVAGAIAASMGSAEGVAAGDVAEAFPEAVETVRGVSPTGL